MQFINGEMQGMWKNSAPPSVRTSFREMSLNKYSIAYNSYQSDIMGTKKQPMFPNGVICEGVDEKDGKVESNAFVPRSPQIYFVPAFFLWRRGLIVAPQLHCALLQDMSYFIARLPFASPYLRLVDKINEDPHPQYSWVLE
jgi:hypothetical protein